MAPALRSQSKTKAAASGVAHTVPPSSQSDLLIPKGVPFRKMYQLRAEVAKTTTAVAQLEAAMANAQRTSSHSPQEMRKLESDLRFMSAELASLRKKLAPMETNFLESKKDSTTRREAASNEPQPAKKPKTEDTEYSETKSLSAEQTPIITGPMMNTATLDVPLAPTGCTLTADECQYDHIERLRRQYIHPFKQFCEEMDSIGDSCLTGICLALPGMPWSIAVSRLAFLFKTTLDSRGNSLALSDARYMSAGTTIGCEQHVRYIRLAEVMVIKDWRDFMRWAHHHSHLFHLCGHRSCIKLKHICLEPFDCTSSRSKCRADSVKLVKGTHSHDEPTNEARGLVPAECDSPGCWPPCLPQHKASNILHSVAIEFAAFHQVSFGPVTSVTKKDLYTPITEHQLGKLVNDEGAGLIFPVQKSYGHILVHKYEDDSFVEVDTLLEIPSTYQSNEVQPILQKLPTWTEISFNDVLSSIFWYARRRNAPFLARQGLNWSARFDHRSPGYQCPFCHGFDNYFDPKDPLAEKIADYDNLYCALRHMLMAHSRVPIVRKVRFLFEETQECPTIGDAWKFILRENYDAVIAILAKGEVPQLIANLCGYKSFGMPTAEVNKDLIVHGNEEKNVVAKEVKSDYIESADALADQPDNILFKLGIVHE
ncbi:hypothetical protein F5Y07DRAFT_408406 [Xylaria sp. FL0933]|nr:hypothetical protein F5Y07DRAFT_408406 [Xylaria sp. FL0933]